MRHLDPVVAATVERLIVCPILPTCSVWHNVGNQCRGKAVYYLIAPDGQPCPGGWVCRDCAVRLIRAYHNITMEPWSLRALKLYRSDGSAVTVGRDGQPVHP